MQKEITLTIPTSYEDITLRKWLELQSELENYEGDDEAITATLLYRLCGLEPAFLKGISFEDYNIIKSELSGFLNNTDLPLIQKWKIGEVEYGFEPNLANLSYGAYLDITKWDTITIDKNWAKIMSILYRPIKERVIDTYSIEPYTGRINEELWLDQPMHLHFGALFFFYDTLMDCWKDILKSLKVEEAQAEYKQILQRSGEAMLQLLSSQVAISPASTLSLTNL